LLILHCSGLSPLHFPLKIILRSKFWRFIVGWVIGTANNAGAILVLGRDLVVVPKLIHPLPPAISSPETSPERHIEDTWMQVLFTQWLEHNISLIK